MTKLSTRGVWSSSCRKLRFEDENAANLELAMIASKHYEHRPKTESRAYHCDRCDGWHLTSWASYDDRRTS